MCLFESDSDLQFQNVIQYPKISIKKNSFVFLTGRSGCGKSTYLKILNRTILPTAGTVLYGGKNINSYPVLDYRKCVLLVPQEVFLIEGTVRQNFDFYSKARSSECLSDQQILRFLEICCSNFTPQDGCNKMSGGERQRVFLAIFLSFANEVLLLDEPTAALDDKTSIELMHNIKQYCKTQGITAVCISHNAHLVDVFADATIHLEGTKKNEH